MQSIVQLWNHVVLTRYSEGGAIYNSLLSKDNEFLNGKDDFIYIPLKSKNDFAYIAEYEKHIVIAYKPTEDLLGAGISNLKLKLVDENPEDLDPSKTVHKGFYETYYNIFKSDIVHYFKNSFNLSVRDFSKCPKKILLAGKSRGGDLALMTGRDFVINRNVDCDCYTYGSMPITVSDMEYNSNRPQLNHYRIVNGNDIVPRLFSILGYTEYKHFGKLIQYPKTLFQSSIKAHFDSSYTKAMIKYYTGIDETCVKLLKQILKTL